jgi:hypothetical protein
MTDYWSGDGRFELPARRVEPYRLWFEFLKLAYRDPDIEVDRDFYADWGDVEGQPFNAWWSNGTWRELFGIDTAVAIVDPKDADAVHPSSLLIQIPLGRDRKSVMRDVRELLDEHSVSGSMDGANRGRFTLTPKYELGFLNQLSVKRAQLRLYGHWLDHRETGERTFVRSAATDLVEWAEKWNEKTQKPNSRLKRIYLPPAITSYVDILRSRRSDRWIPYNDNDLHSAQTQVMRHIKKGRELARNAARGDFPGGKR